MSSATHTEAFVLGDINFQSTKIRTNDHANCYKVTLPKGTAGTLTTRTDDNTGVVTVTSHGITTSDKVDVHWTASGVKKVRYGMSVTATTGTTISVDLGAGDVLPSVNDAVVITKQVQIDTQIDGDDVKISGMMSDQDCHIDMQDSGDATIHQQILQQNIGRVTDIEGGDTNIFTGNPIVKTLATNASSTTDATLKLGFLEDTTA